MKKLASLLIYVGLAINVSAQDILFQETFEDDGSDSRYTVCLLYTSDAADD